MKCRLCSQELRTGKHQCHSCRAWTWGDEPPRHDDVTVLFEDVTSAENCRIKTNLIDENLGGGLVTEAVVLLGGLPGAGKSTLTLQLAAILCNQGECIYIASEEGLPAIKSRGERLRLQTQRRLRFIPALGGADIGEILLSRKPASVILDSIDALAGSDEAQISCLELLKKYSDSLKAPIVVISQVTKDGDFAGLMAKQHAVDCLLILSPEPEERTENGEAVRCLETVKNRHGKAWVKSFYEMGETGLSRLELVDTEEG